MGSRWSHSFLVLEQSQYGADWYVSETSDFQVTVSTLNRYVEGEHKSVEIYNAKGLTPEQMRSIALDSRTRDGMVYGYGQLFSLGVRRLLMRVGIKIGNFIRWGVVCNSHVAYAFKHSGFPEFAGDPEAADTEEMYQAVKASERFELVFSKVYKT